MTSQGVRFSEKTISSVDRGARYKVYEPTNTSQLLTCHRWLTRAACHSLASANDEEAHLVARADRAAGRRESRYRYDIDHGSALLQRNGDARRRSQVKVLVDPRSARLSHRIAFTMRAGRRYLLRSNLLRVLLRTKTGPCARRVRRGPSNTHGRATSETAS